MFIQTESTPNPATLKFLPGLAVLDMGTADFPNAEAATKSPLAKRIFAVEGVTGVFFGMDFVTVTKAEGIDWQHIKPCWKANRRQPMRRMTAPMGLSSPRSKSC